MTINIKTKKRSLFPLVVLGIVLVLAACGVALTFFLSDKNVAVLNPQGVIADQQKDLMIFTVLLASIVIIPVFIMLFAFAWRYRVSNNRAKYTPEVAGNKAIEAVWWGVPIAIIAVLSVVTWITSHQLDPYKQLSSDTPPLKVQVVSLQWRWLFIYPEQQIATINELRIPEKTPVNFEITADSPMSGFWIPNLGSQTYAMNGMRTKLSLMASSTGEYHGSNTNISGEGYAGMRFKTTSMKQKDFDAWVLDVKNSDQHLDWEIYQAVAKPSKDASVQRYTLHDRKLVDRVVAKYMSHDSHETHDTASRDDNESSNDEMDHSMMEHHKGMEH